MEGPQTRALAIRDIKVLDLIQRIDISHDPALDGKGYIEGNPVEIELTDGKVLSAWSKVSGGKDNPVHYEDVAEKFVKLTTGQLTHQKQERSLIFASIWRRCQMFRC